MFFAIVMPTINVMAAKSTINPFGLRMRHNCFAAMTDMYICSDILKKVEINK
ncbi:hypothetical protein D3C76_1610100 [compost metagenome]